MPRQVSVVELIETEVSQALLDKAIRDYGQAFEPQWGPIFAQEVAQGKSFTKSYLELHPGCSDSTARTQGAIAAAHPDVSQWIRTHVYGLVNVARSLTPFALQTLRELAEQSSNLRIRLDAANSILDRGGLPKTSQLQVEGRLSIAVALDEILGGTTDGEALAMPTLDLPVLEPASTE